MNIKEQISELIYKNSKDIAEGVLIEFETITSLIEQIAAISDKSCCEELKGKERMTFEEWLKKLKWKQIGKSYVFQRDNSYSDAETLIKEYNKDQYSL